MNDPKYTPRMADASDLARVAAHVARRQREAVVLSITFTRADIEDMADTAGVSVETAVERATEWAKYIAETATRLISMQLASVIEGDQP